MTQVRQRLPISERRACRVLGQAGTTQRYPPTSAADEARLVARLVELATQYGRYGYRRVTAVLRGEGWPVNHKRLGLIRSCGHFRKGDYDVHDGEDDEAPAGAPAVR